MVALAPPRPVEPGAGSTSYAAPEDPTEMGKLLIALLIEGAPYGLLDNIEGPLRSAKLAAAPTSEQSRDRVLGVSSTAGLTALLDRSGGSQETRDPAAQEDNDVC